MLPETRALDAALELKEASKKFKVRPEFEPQVVQFSGYPRGTIVIDTASHLPLSDGRDEQGPPLRDRRRQGRPAVQGRGQGRRQAGMAALDPDQGDAGARAGEIRPVRRRHARRRQNPLGARAIYLYENGKDTHLRIHGTIAPETIGTNSSNGCFRMINEHVMDLYRRVPVGTSVVVL